MSPASFQEANCTFGPPPELTESQCMRIPAFQGEVRGGSVDGVPLVVVAWKPTPEEIQALAEGALLYLSMCGGLAPHFITLNFHDATHPA